MKIGSFEIGRSKKQEPNKKRSPEIGGSGTTNYGGFLIDNFAEYNNKLKGTLKFDVYNEMRKSDPIIKMTMNLLKYPLKSCVWRVNAASSSEEDNLVARFVNWILFDYMETSFSSFLENALLCLDFGFSVAEPVWGDIVTYYDDISKKSYEVRALKKIAPRLPHTSFKWNLDENDNLVSWTQQVYKQGRFQFPEIPKDKLLIWTLNQEGDYFEGESILRSVFKPWFFKKNAELVQNMGYERFAMGIPYFELPFGANEEDEKRAEQILQDIRSHEKGYLYYYNGWKFGIEKTTGTWAPATELIQAFNHEISSAMLMNFMLLGTTDRGARAVAESLIEPYYLSLKAVANFISEVVNKYLIPKLVEPNFDVKNYPKLGFSRLQANNLVDLSRSISELITSGAIKPDSDLEDTIRALYELPDVNEDAKANNEAAKNEPVKDIPTKDNAPVDEPKKPTSEPLLSAYEAFMDIDTINATLSQAVTDIKAAAKDIRVKQSAALLEQIKLSLDKNDLNSLPNIGVLYKNTLRDQAKVVLERVFNFGRQQVHSELLKQCKDTNDITLNESHSPMIPNGEQYKLEKEKAEAFAFWLATYLADELRQEAIRVGLTNDEKLTNAELAAKVKDTLDNLSDQSISELASMAVNQLFVLGRAYEAELEADNISETVYSTISDSGQSHNLGIYIKKEVKK